jgi:hypothetical protein
MSEVEIARIKVKMDFTNEAYSWFMKMDKENTKEHFLTDKNILGFFRQYKAEWEEILIESSNPIIKDFFIEKGISKEFLPEIRIIKSESGSWIIEARIFILGGVTIIYKALKALSEIPKITDGLKELKYRIEEIFTKRVNELANEKLKRSIFEKKYSSLLFNPITADIVINVDPLTNDAENKSNLQTENLWVKLLEISVNHLNLNWDYVFSIRKWAILIIVGLLTYYGTLQSKDVGVHPLFYTIPFITLLLFFILDVIALSWVWSTLKGIKQKQDKIADVFKLSSDEEKEIIRIVTIRSTEKSIKRSNYIDAICSGNLWFFYLIPLIITLIIALWGLGVIKWLCNLC